MEESGVHCRGSESKGRVWIHGCSVGIQGHGFIVYNKCNLLFSNLGNGERVFSLKVSATNID